MLAVMVKVNGVPVVLDGGAAVMRPAEFKLATELGSVPAVMLNVGAGEPDAATWKVPAVLTTKVVVAADVNAGTVPTRRTAGWLVTGEPTPLLTTHSNWS